MNEYLVRIERDRYICDFIELVVLQIYARITHITYNGKWSGIYDKWIQYHYNMPHVHSFHIDVFAACLYIERTGVYMQFIAFVISSSLSESKSCGCYINYSTIDASIFIIPTTVLFCFFIFSFHTLHVFFFHQKVIIFLIFSRKSLFMFRMSSQYIE